MKIFDCSGSLPGFLAVLGVGTLLAASACAPVGPSYQPPQPELPVAWSRPAPDTAKPEDEVALANWWTLFNDPRLDDLVRRAIIANPDLKMGVARVLQARAQYQLATAQAAPTLGVSGGYSNSRKSDNSGGSGAGTTQDLFQNGFDAGWEVDIFGGARRGAEAAAARLDGAEDNRGVVQVSLTAEVARNYLELRGTQQRLLAARANLAVQEKTLELARGRRESGLANELEVAQAETQLALTSSLLPPLEASVGQSCYRLALLLGQPPQALVTELSPPAPLPVPSAPWPETLPSELLRRRPDIRAAERQLAAATADVGVATAELFPHFSLTGLLGLQSINLSDLLSASSRFWTVGPTVRWSLFNGGRVRANIDLSQARREEAQLGYEKSVLTALSEVESALLALAREGETRRTLAEALAASQRTVELASGRYGAGLAGVLDVLLGERALYQAQDQLLQSEQRLAVNQVALCKALGGGWQVPPNPLPNALPVATPVNSSIPAKE